MIVEGVVLPERLSHTNESILLFSVIGLESSVLWRDVSSMFIVGRWVQEGGQNRVREKAPFLVPSFFIEPLHSGRKEFSSSTPLFQTCKFLLTSYWPMILVYKFLLVHDKSMFVEVFPRAKASISILTG